MFMMIWLKIMFIIGIMVLIAILGVYAIRFYDKELR